MLEKKRKYTPLSCNNRKLPLSLQRGMGPHGPHWLHIDRLTLMWVLWKGSYLLCLLSAVVVFCLGYSISRQFTSSSTF